MYKNVTENKIKKLLEEVSRDGTAVYLFEGTITPEAKIADDPGTCHQGKIMVTYCSYYCCIS